MFLLLRPPIARVAFVQISILLDKLGKFSERSLRLVLGPDTDNMRNEFFGLSGAKVASLQRTLQQFGDSDLGYRLTTGAMAKGVVHLWHKTCKDSSRQSSQTDYGMYMEAKERRFKEFMTESLPILRQEVMGSEFGEIRDAMRQITTWGRCVP